jgi:CTP:molybdopterin cytidylyltransferase MocA
VGLDAIVLAGGDPARDADLLAYAGSAPRKPLIKLGDKTFLELIVSALQGSGYVRRIVVVGLPVGYQSDMGSQVAFVPDAGSMLQNGEAGLAYLRSAGGVSERLVVATGDIPLVTPAILRDTIELHLRYDVDFCYSIVRQETMEDTFPGSGRTFVPIGGDRFAGGDINVVKPHILDTDRTKLDEIIGERKTFWKQVRTVGLDTLFLFLIRRLTLTKIERRVEKALGFTGRAVICSHAEVAMDVDKPHHLDVVRAAWERRQRQTRPG